MNLYNKICKLFYTNNKQLNIVIIFSIDFVKYNNKLLIHFIIILF